MSNKLKGPKLHCAHLQPNYYFEDKQQHDQWD